MNFQNPCLADVLSTCVYKYLTIKDVLEARQTCKLWCNASCYNDVWLKSLQNTIPDLSKEEVQRAAKDAIMVYQARQRVSQFRPFSSFFWKPELAKTVSLAHGELMRDHLFTCTDQGLITQAELKTGKCIRSIQAGRPGMAVREYKIHENKLFVCTASPVCMMWDLITGITRFFEGHLRNITSLTVNDKGLFTVSEDCTAKKWDIASGACVRTYEGHTHAILACKVIGQDLYTSSSDKSIRRWNIESGEFIRSFPTAWMSKMKVFEGHLFTAAGDRCVKKWNIESGACVTTFQGHAWMIRKIEVTKRHLFTGSIDLTAKMWDVNSGALLRTFKGHGGCITFMKATGDRLFTGSADGTVRLWDVNTGAQVHREVMKGAVSSLIYGEGRLVIAGSKEVRIYDFNPPGFDEKE